MKKVGILMAAMAVGLRVWAGDLTVDNMTVLKSATLYGDLVVTQWNGAVATNGWALGYSFSADTNPVPDDSGNGNVGYVNGATWTNNGPTNATGAYSFDGVADYIALANSTQLDFEYNQEFTIAFWVYVNDPGSIYALVAKQDLTYTGYWGGYDGTGNMSGYIGGLWFGVYAGPNIYRTTCANVTTNFAGGWHHLALMNRYTGGNWECPDIYVDGQLHDDFSYQGGTPGSMHINRIFRLGSMTEGWLPLNGEMSDVRVYGRALSSMEVQALAQAGGSNPPPKVSFGVAVEAAQSVSAGTLTVSGTGTFAQVVGGGAGLTGIGSTSIADGAILSQHLNLTNLAVGGNTFVVTNGCVGVGTATPQAAFHVTGAARLDCVPQQGDLKMGTFTNRP